MYCECSQAGESKENNNQSLVFVPGFCGIAGLCHLRFCIRLAVCGGCFFFFFFFFLGGGGGSLLFVCMSICVSVVSSSWYQWVGVCFVIVTFPGHTYSFFE